MNENQYESVRLDSFEGTSKYAPTAYVDPQTLAEWRMRQNAEAIYKASRELVSPLTGRAYDAVSSDRSLFLARELEFTHNRVLEDVYEDLNAETLIPTDSSVPPGAKTHTIQRESAAGEMVWFRGNSSNKGQVSVEREEKEYKIHAAVTSIKINFFDDLNAKFAGFPLESRLRKAAERVAREFKNEKTFTGDEARGVPGMFNAPFSPKVASGVTFGPGGGTVTAQLAELHRLANLIGEQTNDKFGPSAAAMPIKYVNYFRNTMLDTSNGSNRSILDAFLQDNDYVNSVVKVRECTGAGVGGTDILQFLRPGDSDSAHCVVPQGLTWMPMERSGFDMDMDAYMLFGGVNQYQPLNNLVVYASYE